MLKNDCSSKKPIKLLGNTICNSIVRLITFFSFDIWINSPRSGLSFLSPWYVGNAPWSSFGLLFAVKNFRSWWPYLPEMILRMNLVVSYLLSTKIMPLPIMSRALSSPKFTLNKKLSLNWIKYITFFIIFLNIMDILLIFFNIVLISSLVPTILKNMCIVWTFLTFTIASVENMIVSFQIYYSLLLFWFLHFT